MIDLGTDDPLVAEILSRGLAIIDDVVSSLHDEVLTIEELPPRCELLRLVTELPRGPLDVSGASAVALANARGALDHISYLIQNPVPTSPIVLHALLRAALVGSARTLYVLLPQDPQTRLERGRAILARDCESGRQGLEKFATFEGMRAIAAPEALVEAGGSQRKQLWPKGNPPGDGQIIEGMTRSIVDALELAGLSEEFGPDILRDHSNWLWKTYSGLAHGYMWPRLLWRISRDRRLPGDFPFDLYQVATATHVALLAALSRSQPDTAATTTLVSSEWRPQG